jgi:hypothetical protein
MSDLFTPVGADGAPLDPTKSVRFVEGMVLGVDDFQQEHAYLAGRANEALRWGTGPGTLYGLKVTVPKIAATGPGTVDRFEVRVGAGKAIDGRGRLIGVPEEQCADLATWIAGQPGTALNPKVSIPNAADQLAGLVTVVVTVSYTRTPTDAVPVPGEPCRTDDQLTVASRWRDDFQLNLALDPPQPSRLREAMRQFLVWSEYAFTFADPTAANAVDLTLASLQACRAPANATPPRLLEATRPGAVAPIAIAPTDLETQMACLDAASVVLVTELLPDWLTTESPTMPAETPDTLLLAEIQAPVKRASTAATDPWVLDTNGTLTVSSRGRPVALAGPTLRVGPRAD